MVLSCPFCQHGSDQLFARASRLSEWDEVDCPSCGEIFSSAEAIDEMFARGDIFGYALWTHGVGVAGTGSCRPGRSVLLDVRGKLDCLYHAVAPRRGTYLAGGLSIHYVSQGYLMVAIAPELANACDRPVDLTVFAVGRQPGSAMLRGWRTLLLEARRCALRAPTLTVLLCVAAIDSFFEGLTGRSLKGSPPNAWNRALAQATGQELWALLPHGRQSLAKLVGMRGALAHGRDHLACLDDANRDREQEWNARSRYYEDWTAPSALWALRTTLTTLRVVQRNVDPALV